MNTPVTIRSATLCLALFVSAGTVQADAWPAQTLDRTGGKFDPDSGLPVVDPYGRQEIEQPAGFRPFLVEHGNGHHILRFDSSDTADPPEIDLDTGLPLLGSYFDLALLSLGPEDNWSRAPAHTGLQELRSPGLVIAGGPNGDPVTYHLEDDHLILFRAAGESVTRRQLPLEADAVAIAYADEDSFHAVWLHDAVLSHGHYRDDTWSTAILDERDVAAFRIVADADGTAYVAYATVAPEGAGTAFLMHRVLHGDEAEPAETIHQGVGVVTHVDLALDSEGNPSIAYVDPFATTLRFASRAGPDAWEVDDVIASDSVLGATALGFDAEGVPTLAYTAADGRELRLASRNTSAWESQTLASSAFSGFFRGVALGFRGDTPLILTAESESNHLKIRAPEPLPSLYPIVKPEIEITRAYILEWEGEVGIDPTSRLEWTSNPSDPSSWANLPGSTIERFTDSEGKRRFRTTVEADTERRFFRAVVTGHPENQAQ